MSDKEFREKCRIISNVNIDDYIDAKDSVGSDLVMHQKEDVEALRTAALLYIAANMPGFDESNKQPCEYCNPKKRKIFHNPCGSISHYLYVNTKQKKLADVYDKTEDKWVAIKYCPMCGRKL